MLKGEPLTVKVYADIINSLKLDSVTVLDPHSEVTPALINNCHVISNHSFIKEVVNIIDKEVVLISPDGGALKKIFSLSKSLGGLSVIECSKTRNTENGSLTGFKAYV